MVPIGVRASGSKKEKKSQGKGLLPNSKGRSDMTSAEGRRKKEERRRGEGSIRGGIDWSPLF